MGCRITGHDFAGVLQAGGVLLACPDSNVSSAASAAVVSSLSPGCGHCLQHFTMPQLAAMIRAGQGSDLAGQAQKSLVKTLQGCSHAVVVVEGIEAMPSALLPVFINALSEHGHFEHNGKQVPAWNALVVATVVMPTGDLQQVRPDLHDSSLLHLTFEAPLLLSIRLYQVVKVCCSCLCTASIANTRGSLESKAAHCRSCLFLSACQVILNSVC